MLILDLYKLLELLPRVGQLLDLAPERFTLVVEYGVACGKLVTIELR